MLVVLWGGNGDARSAENSNGKPFYYRLNSSYGQLAFFPSMYFLFKLCMSAVLSLCKHSREISVDEVNMGAAYSE